MRGKLRSRAGKDRLIAYSLVLYLFLCRFSRLLIALVSLGVATFATYQFIGAVRSDEGEYTERLIYWFVACLAWFHTKYALDKKLTETRARLIDYGYLGVAAMGVIFFALAYSEQRSAAQENLRKAIGEPLGMTLNAIQHDLKGIFDASCDTATSARPMCTFIVEVRSC